MAFILADRVQETTAVTGTGAATPTGAVLSNRTFTSVLAASDTTDICIVDRATGDWETSTATWNGTTLTRTTILASSNAGAAVNFAAGTKFVFICASAVRRTFAGRTIAPSLAANQNDWNPTDWTIANEDNAATIMITLTADVLITGLAGGVDGREVTIVINSDFLVIMPMQSASSTAANRFDDSSLGTLPLFLMFGDSVTFRYDGTASRWKLIASSNGTGPEQFDLWDDFLNPIISTTTNALMGLGKTEIAGTAATTGSSVVLENTTEKPFGIISMATGTTATGRCYVRYANQTSPMSTMASMLCISRVVPTALSVVAQRFQPFIGFHDAATAADVVDGVYWTYRDQTSANWIFGAAGTSTRTETASSVAVSITEYIWLGVFFNKAGTRAAYFTSTDSVTWVFAGTITTADLPTNAEFFSPSVGVTKTLGTTASVFNVDVFAYRYTRNLVRG